MGVSNSCQSRLDASSAKLILHDGRLKEFSYPIKVSKILEGNPGCFICNSNDMDYDDYVSPMNRDEELQLGQLYFALPVNRLNSRLRAPDMAALAVKATLALKMGGRNKWWWRVPVEFRGNKVAGTSQLPTVSDGKGAGGFVGNKRGRGRKLIRQLSVILE